MQELNRICCILAQLELNPASPDADELRTELAALCQVVHERSRALRGYHQSPRGKAALVRYDIENA